MVVAADIPIMVLGCAPGPCKKDQCQDQRLLESPSSAAYDLSYWHKGGLRRRTRFPLSDCNKVAVHCIYPDSLNIPGYTDADEQYTLRHHHSIPLRRFSTRSKRPTLSCAPLMASTSSSSERSSSTTWNFLNCQFLLTQEQHNSGLSRFDALKAATQCASPRRACHSATLSLTTSSEGDNFYHKR